MSLADLIIIIATLILCGTALVMYACLYVGGTYDRQVAEIYRREYERRNNPIGIDADELACRVHEYCKREHSEPMTKTKRIFLTLANRPDPVEIFISDNRQQYLVKLGLYDEQTSNFIHLLKADLELNGMS